VGGAQISVNGGGARRRRRVTDGKKFIAFFTFYDFLSLKNMI
jgi:hypothetical protein